MGIRYYCRLYLNMKDYITTMSKSSNEIIEELENAKRYAELYNFLRRISSEGYNVGVYRKISD